MNETIAIIILGIYVLIFIAIECYTMYYTYQTHKLIDGNLGIKMNNQDIRISGFNWMKVYTVPISAMSNQYTLTLSIMSSYDVDSFTIDVKSRNVSYIILMGTIYSIQYYMSDNFHVMFWVNSICGSQGIPIVCGIPYLKPVVIPRVVQLLGYTV